MRKTFGDSLVIWTYMQVLYIILSGNTGVAVFRFVSGSIRMSRSAVRKSQSCVLIRITRDIFMHTRRHARARACERAMVFFERCFGCVKVVCFVCSRHLYRGKPQLFDDPSNQIYKIETAFQLLVNFCHVYTMSQTSLHLHTYYAYMTCCV